MVSTNADGLRTSLSQGDESIDIAFSRRFEYFGWGVDNHETYDAQLQKDASLKGIECWSTGSFLFSNPINSSQSIFLCINPNGTILVLSMHDHNQTAISDVERSGSVHGIIPHVRLFA